MAAIFYKSKSGNVSIISNNMSILNAGFVPARSYYNKSGDTMSYYFNPADDSVLAKTSIRHHQPIIDVYGSKAEANKAFKRINDGLTFQTGKWIPEKRK